MTMCLVFHGKETWPLDLRATGGGLIALAQPRPCSVDDWQHRSALGMVSHRANSMVSLNGKKRRENLLARKEHTVEISLEPLHPGMSGQKSRLILNLRD